MPASMGSTFMLIALVNVLIIWLKNSRTISDAMWLPRHSLFEDKLRAHSFKHFGEGALINLLRGLRPVLPWGVEHEYWILRLRMPHLSPSGRDLVFWTNNDLDVWQATTIYTTSWKQPWFPTSKSEASKSVETSGWRIHAAIKSSRFFLCRCYSRTHNP